MTMDHSKKIYLGDGAFVQLGSFATEVVLTTEDGISVQNRVVLGPSEIDALMGWLKRQGLIYDDELSTETPQSSN